MPITLVLAIAITVLCLGFVLQNGVPATVVFLLWRFDSSLGLVVLLALALGGIVVALATAPAALRAKWNLGRQSREIANLQASNAELRARLQSLSAANARGSVTAGTDSQK